MRTEEHRNWFEATLRSIADALIATDTSGAITDMNPAAERLTGWTLPEARSRSIDAAMEIRRRSTGERLECPVFRVLRGEVFEAEDALPCDAELVRRDGTTVSIADSVAVIRDPSGSTSGAVMVFRDVTSRVREVERLAFLARAAVEMNASLDYEATLANVARIAVPVIADGCAVVMVHDRELSALATAHVDPAKAECMRAHFASKLAAAPLPVIEVGEPQLKLGEVCREVMRALRATSYLCVPLQRGANVIGAIILLSSSRQFDASDLSVAVALAERAAISVEHARLFQDLDSARKEAERANRAKDAFLAMLGHELRNPLAPITTALELMKLRSNAAAELGVAERQVKHLRRLVDDLLDISRITAAKLVVTKQPTDLAEVIANGVDLAAPLLERKQHELEVSIAPDLWVDGDAVRLAQVVSNLLGNAAKYSDDRARIWLTARRQRGEIVLTIRDEGIGIDASVLPHIFEPFVQQPQGLDRADGGLGLGLAIVRGIVTAHGGTVVAHSAGPGRGTEIELRLPARDPVAADHACDRAFSHPRTRVLVVDDNDDARILLAELLRHLGYEVMSAPDAPTALELARSEMPSIALLDIGLPGVDGYELARRFREQDPSGDLRLIALTGYGLESDRARARAAGFDLHLVKPVTTAILESTLEACSGP
jgi:PAS domain S-box-containing protein